MEKKEIRRQILKIRDKLDEKYQKEADEKISQRLLSLAQYQEASWIFAFVSYKSEVDTKNIITTAIKQKKKVAIPKVLSDGYMEFYEISSLKELVCGYQGILEPDITKKEPVFIKEIKENILMLMPGAAFDRKCHRIGYGGGFYDRYLEKNSCEHMETIALAYQIQVIDEIPICAYDRNPSWVLTENEMFTRKEN